MDRGYDNAVLVFDTKENLWGTVEAVSQDPELLGPQGECGPFPSNVAMPQVSVRGDRIAVVGGEADERVIRGHKYGHDSDMAVVGRMSVLSDRLPRGKSDDRQGVWRQPSSAGWPTPNWTTVPTYTFCGPNKRLLNKAELDFLAGKTAAGYLPR